MLDRDLAELYGVETRDANQSVRRNLERFPPDFMFELTRGELAGISQFVTSPNVTREMIRVVLNRLKAEKRIYCQGRGSAAMWYKQSE